MGDQLRYNMEHAGDILFDKFSSAWDSVKGSTRGISLTCKIDELKKEKRKLVNRIGQRVVGVRSGKPDFDFTSDEKLNFFFNKLDGIQKQIDDSIAERKARLYPGR